jgi:hypothetical protein
MIKKIKISCLMSYCNLQEEEEKEDILPYKSLGINCSMLICTGLVGQARNNSSPKVYFELTKGCGSFLSRHKSQYPNMLLQLQI